MAKYYVADTLTGQLANRLKTDTKRRIEEIRADKSLSPEGRRQRIADEYLYARRKLREYEAAETAEHATKVKNLRRDLFGLLGTTDPSSAISFRDAQDRVTNLKPDMEDEALELLDCAELSGDSILAKAIVTRALDTGWNKVVDAYADNHPAYTHRLNELRDLQPATDLRSQLMELFDTGGGVFHIDAPAEIPAHYDDQQIESIVNTPL